MKKAVLGCVFLLCCLQTSIAQETKQTFTSELGKFSIAHQSEIRESSKQNENSTVYRAAFRDQDMMFVVSSTHQKNQANNIDNLLNASLKNFTTATKATLLSQKIVSEKGTKGVHAILKMEENGLQAEYKVYAKGLYLYQLMVFAKAENFKAPQANSFFNSFAMLE
uniref:hypothetical protein n=1 Tax=Polaribacter sp. TaxID=1920175 RepID=UPI0040471C4D